MMAEKASAAAHEPTPEPQRRRRRQRSPEEVVRSLQERIVKATQEGRWRGTASFTGRWRGMSRMTGNCHVRFLEGGAAATSHPHSAIRCGDGG